MDHPLVIYHGNCYDGFTAAWVARQDYEHFDLHAAKYGEQPPDVRGRTVYVLDFSYPRETLLRMKSEAKWLRVLDHHKTAAADLDGLDFCEFDMERSGCRMAWDHFFGPEKEAPPQLLLWIEDRDLWRFRYGDDTKMAHAYIASLPMTMAEWDRAFAMEPAQIVESGKAIRRYIDTYCEKAAQETRIVHWANERAAIVNVPYQNASEMAGVVLEKNPDCNFSVGWFQRADGRVQFSLRSRSDFDVSVVAKQYGGGGHAGAAGFDLPLDEALNLIR